MIDVIIPAYRGLDATRRCVQSVLDAGCDAAHEVVVIDDASPEPALSEWLREVAASGRVRLIPHADNRGFVASVNEGMRLHPERDVVLLNSDAEVPPRWLDRLVACAAREPMAATVTPFSNNATICSYPRFAAPNPLPAGLTTATLDRFFAAENAGGSVDIPTAVGFCMFIARAALEAVGPFDEEAFGRGYGEEVDFCMRAARAGFRHLLCADLFVYHEGEVSFGSGGAAIRERAQATIDERYPEFREDLRHFLEREPARPWRRRVDVARLRASPRSRVLIVTHDWGGGVERHVNDLVRLLADDCEVLRLRPDGDAAVEVAWLREGEELRAWFDASEWPRCVALLESLGIARVLIHHVHDLPREVLDLPRRLGAAYDVTLHDYYPICPRYHLAPAAGRHCGEESGARCERCLEGGPAQWGLSLEAWRTLFQGFLQSAARVIVPSQDAAARIRRYFPDVAPLVWPHPEVALTAPPRYKVALVGGISIIKGARVLEACVRDAVERGLPLHFHVVGHVDRPMDTWPTAPLTVTGSYEDAKLAELLAIERPDAILFLSQVPETYSYTLSAAMDTGLPIVAPRLGAFPERLRGYRAHALFPHDVSAAAINDTLLLRLGSGASGQPTAASG